MSQQGIDFSLPLTVQFPTLRDLLVHVVYGARKSLNGVAADIDKSPSELCKMLNRDADDRRKLDVEDLVGIIASTGDTRPIQWLVEKFQRDPEQVRAQATQQLAAVLPALMELCAQAGVSTPKARR